MEGFALIIQENGSGRRLRRFIEQKMAPEVDQEFDLCGQLSFGKRRVIHHAGGPGGETEVHFRHFDTVDFEKFKHHLLGSPDWELIES